MGYNATYTEADVSPAILDTLVKIVVVFGTLGTIIGFAIVYVLLKKNVR